jgi:hypothetical protein
MTWPATAGIALLASAVVLMWLSKGHRHAWRLVAGAFCCLCLVGVLDLYLIAAGLATITQSIQAALTVWQRAGVMCGLVAVTWAALGWRYVVPVAIAVIYGHLFWQ